MTLEDRILETLETMMESGCTAEEVCATCPDLLPEIRVRWKNLQDIASQIESLFPDDKSAGEPDDFEQISTARTLPEIRGYRVESVLGRGGMGVVYKARHLQLGRSVALKMLPSGIYAGPDERTRLMREARAVAGLRHPHIVQVYDVGELNGCPYFTMEFLEGGNLSQKQAGKPQPVREAAGLVAVLAAAMHLAHQSGVVHRDLKPSNILLTVDGTPKITDFGLARRMDDDDGVTQAGVRVGTPSYMAPEQALGTAQAIGPAADTYALGAIFYELLTGRPPFQGATSTETISQLLLHDPVPPGQLIPRLPRDLDTICLKCLQKLAERRYLTCADLAGDLERFLRGDPILARPVGKVELLARWTARHKGIAAALAAVVMLLLLLVTVSVGAAAHFRQMEAAQHSLALNETRARLKADQAQASEAALRKDAEKQGEEIRQTLYFAQMNLAGQAARSPGGIGRVRDWLARWENGRPDLRGWEWYYLDSLCHRDRLTLRGHTDDVMHVAWSPDSRRIASASGDGHVKVWDATAGDGLLNINAHDGDVHMVAWSPDGRRLVTASWDRTVKIWDAANGSPIYTFRAHTGKVFSVAWSPDGTRLASGDETGTILIWDAATFKVTGELHGHVGPVYTLAWSHDGSWLASGNEDGTIQIWNTAAAKEVVTLRGHLNWVRQVAWSPDDTRLASASSDNLVKIWDVNAKKELLTLRGHTLPVSSVSWNADGTRLATGSDDQTIKIWNAADGAELVTLRGHSMPVHCVAWSPDGKQIASGSGDLTVKVWDAAATPEISVLAGHRGMINSLSWSPDSAYLASASDDGTAKGWNISTRREAFSTPASTSAIKVVAFSPDGKHVALADQRPSIEIWDTANLTKTITITGHLGREVYSVVWSPDSRVLTSTGADGPIQTWDANTGNELHTFAEQGADVNSVAWSPDGVRFATGGSDGFVKVWQAATGALVLQVQPQWGSVKSVSWSPDGRSIASACTDQTIMILSAETGAVARTLRGHTSGVNAVVWSPDSARLASGGEDQTVRIWDAATGNETLTFGPEPAVVRAIAWSPNGMLLAVGDTSKNVAVYDATKGYLRSWSAQVLPALNARLAADPKRAADWHLLAQIQATAGNWDQAATALDEYLALNPDEHWSTLGYWVAGPYSQDLSAHFAPETHLEPNEPLVGPSLTSDRAIGWQPAPADHEGFVDLGAQFGNAEHISGYAMLKVYCPAQERPVAVLLGADDQVRLWFNGKQVYEDLTSDQAVPDIDAVAVTLRAGWNTLLARVVNITGAHALYLRISDAPTDMARVNGLPMH
jgi:WD40 repeat protein/predicted Ser/Thr protein kinase